jgi:hypothetical protein
MKKYLLSFAVLLMGCSLFTACDDDENEKKPGEEQPSEKTAVDVSNGVFVVCSGNMQSSINGSLTYFDYATQKTTANLFKDVNKRELGVTANDGLVYGTKLYVVVDGENTVEVMDAQTCKSIATISTTQLMGDKDGVSPRHIVANAGNIFVSTFGGYVAVIDTVDYKLVRKMEAGSYPEGMAFSGKMLFVANSNYGLGENPSVSVLNSETGVKMSDLTDDLINNPTALVADGYTLYILCGDTYDPQTWAVKKKGGLRKYTMGKDAKVEEVNDAGLIAGGDGCIYYVLSPYYQPQFMVMDLKTGESKTFTTEGVDIPNAMGVDPVTGDLVIVSYKNNPETGYGDYLAPGYGVRYDKTGKKLGQFETGVGPAAVFFNKGVRYE